MYLVKTPQILKILFPSLIWEGPKTGKTIYLTFDDGPIPNVTPWVLEQLEKYGAKATFFCIGDNVQKHPEIYNEILKKGHSVGNHTFNHLNGWRTSTPDYTANMLKCKELVQSDLFRPPYGRIKKSQIKALKTQHPGIKIIMWDILSGDFDQNLKPENCLQKVIAKTKSGSIIVFHDSLKAEKNLRYALPRALEFWKNEGYQFKTL